MRTLRSFRRRILFFFRATAAALFSLFGGDAGLDFRHSFPGGGIGLFSIGQQSGAGDGCVGGEEEGEKTQTDPETRCKFHNVGMSFPGRRLGCIPLLDVNHAIFARAVEKLAK